MKKLAAAAVMSGVLVVVAPSVSHAAQPAASSASVTGISVLQAEGVVQSVDPVAHTVTVKDAVSGQATFNVSPETTKLSALKSGDKVRVRMVRDAVIVPEGSSANAMSPSTKGDATAQSTIAAQVVAVDSKTGVIALKGAQGNVFHVQASDASQSASLSSGMRVQVNYAAMAAVSVAAAQ
ncbi:MAG TPA: hypothetical protein VNE00_14235 [Paraburkholderia sp.]|jgi:Cu/Ag efflux protein CusF|nr:hypothetical protein [Paraburkholderia sp.]